jgi:drug/metabolite transporter (DMT)-like permease
VNLVPVIALSLGVMFMDETLNFPQTMACVVVFAGVLLSQIRPLKPGSRRTRMVASKAG